MPIMSPGYFPDTYFADRYWQDDYWPDFGVIVIVTERIDVLSHTIKCIDSSSYINRIEDKNSTIAIGVDKRSKVDLEEI